MDGGLVDTVTTGDNGRVHVDLDAGSYYALEIEAAKGFQVDNTPHYFTVEDGKTTTLTVTNKAFSGILIHKIDSATKEGMAYFDYRKHGQFEWTGPVILFACLVFTLTAPNYIWGIIGI